MSDLISRAAAIKPLMAVKAVNPSIARCVGVDWCIDEIKALPSAQLAQDLPNGCTDTISRQAALDALPKKQKGIGGESWMKTYRRSGYNDCVEDCMKVLQALPSAQPGWIPTSERLPEEETIYLITFGSGHVRLSSWHKDTKYNHGFDNIETGFLEDGTMVHFGVTAWMPLPTPYREGEQDETKP